MSNSNGTDSVPEDSPLPIPIHPRLYELRTDSSNRQAYDFRLAVLNNPEVRHQINPFDQSSVPDAVGPGGGQSGQVPSLYVPTQFNPFIPPSPFKFFMSWIESGLGAPDFLNRWIQDGPQTLTQFSVTDPVIHSTLEPGNNQRLNFGRILFASDYSVSGPSSPYWDDVSME